MSPSWLAIASVDVGFGAKCGLIQESKSDDQTNIAYISRLNLHGMAKGFLFICIGHRSIMG